MFLDPRYLARYYETTEELVRKINRQLRILTLRNSKLAKSDDATVDASLEMAPAWIGGFNVCQHSTPGCRRSCIFTSGKGAVPSVYKKRLWRKVLFFKDRPRFAAYLHHDIAILRGSIDLLPGAKPGLFIRLNTFSDLPWERINIYPGITVPRLLAEYEATAYDYTADEDRYDRWLNGDKSFGPYHLTFSRKETTPDLVVTDFITRGGTVTMPFATVPSHWNDWPVINGDNDDRRYLDPPGVVIGLSPRGKGKTDDTGFIIRSAA